MSAGNDLDSVWVDVLTGLLRSPVVLNDRTGQETREEIGCNFIIFDPRCNILKNPVRELSPVYAAGELAWYLSGSDQGDMITAYAPSYSRFLDDNGRANGAYGARWKRNNQLDRCIRLLKRDPSTRQAVITMYDGTIDFEAGEKGSKDVPCTVSIQFLIRAGKLHCVVFMRSNDAWLGLPYDVFCFTSLQIIVAHILQYDIGYYHHHVGSLHLYDKQYEKAREAVKCDHLTESGSLYHREYVQYLTLQEAEQQIPLFVLQEKELRCKNSLVDGVTMDYLNSILKLCAYNFGKESMFRDSLVPERIRLMASEWVEKKRSKAQ